MKKLAGLVVLLAMTSSAYAGGGGGGGLGGLLCQIELKLGMVPSCPSGGGGSGGGSGPTAAPEIDPASAMTALTLVLGGLAVVRGRRTQSR
jgi:hypothetical protein